MFNSKELEILKKITNFMFSWLPNDAKKIIFRKYLQLKEEGYSSISICRRIMDYLYRELGKQVSISESDYKSFNNLIFNLNLKQNRKYVKFLIQDLYERNSIDKKIIKAYPFLDDHTFLVAEIVFKTNLQPQSHLTFIRFNKDMSKRVHLDTMTCVHVVIDKVATADFFEQMGNKEKQIAKLKEYEKKNLTSEYMKNSISLSPAESFKALCIYVGGIAEAGMDAFFLSRELADSVSGGFTIGKRLFQMILNSMNNFQEMSNYILEYLEYCNKICRFENELHIASMRANINFLLDSVCEMIYEEDYIKIIEDYAQAIGMVL